MLRSLFYLNSGHTWPSAGKRIAGSASAYPQNKQSFLLKLKSVSNKLDKVLAAVFSERSKHTILQHREKIDDEDCRINGSIPTEGPCQNSSYLKTTDNSASHPTFQINEHEIQFHCAWDHWLDEKVWSIASVFSTRRLICFGMLKCKGLAAKCLVCRRIDWKSTSSLQCWEPTQINPKKLSEFSIRKCYQ